MKNKIIAILLVAGILAVPVAMAASQQSAQLDVRQPGWVDGEVQQKSVNGTNLYSARGTEIRIVPKNFNGSEVIDFGVETDPGSMEYDSEFNEFVFTPNGETGTFEVYWIVNEQRVVTVNNSTQVRSTQVRYTALIRVTGGVDVSHIPNQELQERKNATALGEQMQDAIDRIREMSLPLALNSGSDEEIAQAMVTRYVNTGNPIRALTGNYTAVAIIIGTTLGGLLWALQYLGILAWMIRSLRGQLNRYEVMEAEEGEVSDKVARVDEMERKGILQNVDWNDIFHDDHIARAFRETFGETPHDGYKKLVNTVILPEVWVKERLYAMSQDGWTIDLDTMELVEPGGDGADIAENMSQDLLDELDWDSDALREYDLPNSDVDTSEFDQTPTTMTLGELLDELDLQMHHFENEKAAGECFRDYIEYIVNHPYTDSDGRVNESREMLNSFLKLSQLLGDKYGYPEPKFVREAVEKALVDWDPSEQAKTFVKEVESSRA